jgi:hypothetical protein
VFCRSLLVRRGRREEVVTNPLLAFLVILDCFEAIFVILKLFNVLFV